MGMAKPQASNYSHIEFNLMQKIKQLTQCQMRMMCCCVSLKLDWMEFAMCDVRCDWVEIEWWVTWLWAELYWDLVRNERNLVVLKEFQVMIISNAASRSSEWKCGKNVTLPPNASCSPSSMSKHTRAFNETKKTPTELDWINFRSRAKNLRSDMMIHKVDYCFSLITAKLVHVWRNSIERERESSKCFMSSGRDHCFADEINVR